MGTGQAAMEVCGGLNFHNKGGSCHFWEYLYCETLRIDRVGDEVCMHLLILFDLITYWFVLPRCQVNIG